MTLTAVASTNSVFVGWSGGGCAGVGSCTVNLSADTVITATFDLKKFTLAVNKNGTGSGTVVSSNGEINCGASCTGIYEAGTTFMLWATADPGFVFSAWSFAGCTPLGGCFVTLNADTTVTATFNSPMPSIDGSQLSDGEVNLPYTTRLELSGGLPPYTIAVIKGSLPRGLNLLSPYIFGTPTVSGQKTFTFKVTDQSGSSASKEFKLQIFPRLRVTTLALPAGKVGRVYSKILNAQGGPSQHSWLLISGNLPPGLNLDPSTGQITGTPTGTGSFNPTFQVTDPLGGQAQKSFTLKIK